jgi:hypothetical protein
MASVSFEPNSLAIERRTGLGAYAGAPRLDLGLLHFEISRPIACLLPFGH